MLQTEGQVANSSTSETKSGHSSKWLILLAVMLGSIMGPLDGSIVNTVQPRITQYFNTDIATVEWVPIIYLITISCLVLLYGRLGDMFGYRRIYLFGLGAFTVTSMLCGFSQSIWMLIVFRALQGLAAGMMMSVGYAIITAAFPPKERGKAMGIYAISIAVGLSLGPVLGGVIAQYYSWRYVFFINLPIGIAALLWGSRILPTGSTKKEQHLDWLGALTALVFLLSLILYTNKGEDWGWLSPLSASFLTLGIVFGTLFFWVELTSKQPMLNLTLFRNRVFGFGNLSALFSFMSIYGVIFLTPFYLTFILHKDPLHMGLIMASAPIATLFVAPLSGVFSDRVGARGLAFCGMAVCATALFLLSSLKASSDTTDVVWRLAIFGVGTGLFQSPNNSTVMGSVPGYHRGIASGTLTAMRNVGMALGIAISGAILYNVAPVAASVHHGSLDGTDWQQFLSGLSWAYIGGAILAIASALASLIAAGQRQEAAPEGVPHQTTVAPIIH